MKKILLIILISCTYKTQTIDLAFFKKYFETSEKIVAPIIVSPKSIPNILKDQGIATVAGLALSLSAHLIKQIYPKPDCISVPISLALGLIIMGATFKKFDTNPSSGQILTTAFTALFSEIYIWKKLFKDNRSNNNDDNDSRDGQDLRIIIFSSGQ